jgi:hypothetical protein
MRLLKIARSACIASMCASALLAPAPAAAKSYGDCTVVVGNIYKAIMGRTADDGGLKNYAADCSSGHKWGKGEFDNAPAAAPLIGEEWTAAAMVFKFRQSEEYLKNVLSPEKEKGGCRFCPAAQPSSYCSRTAPPPDDDPVVLGCVTNVAAAVCCRALGSSGTTFVLGAVGVATLYLAVFGIVNFSGGKRGADLLPHRPFWAELGALVLDGAFFARALAQPGRPASRRPTAPAGAAGDKLAAGGDGSSGRSARKGGQDEAEARAGRDKKGAGKSGSKNHGKEKPGEKERGGGGAGRAEVDEPLLEGGRTSPAAAAPPAEARQMATPKTSAAGGGGKWVHVLA